MPTLSENVCYLGYVAWCLRRKHGYLVGIAFIDEQTLFKARMGEQVCQIERYYRQQERLREQQGIQALALEWVDQHATEYSQETVHQAFVQPALD